MVWQRYVGPTWQSVTEALSRLPVALDASPEALHEGAKRVGAAVAASLENIGFRHFDSFILTEFFAIPTVVPSWPPGLIRPDLASTFLINQAKGHVAAYDAIHL